MPYLFAALMILNPPAPSEENQEKRTEIVITVVAVGLFSVVLGASVAEAIVDKTGTKYIPERPF